MISSDGSARWTGVGVERDGVYEGQVFETAFRRLAQFIANTHYMAYGHTYSVRVSDQPTVYTAVVQDGERQVVANYGNAGPVQLWAIEQLIDVTLDGAEWKRIGRAER